MKKRVRRIVCFLIFVLSFVLLNTSSSWASLNIIEVAIMQKDYKSAKMNAEQYLNNHTQKNEIFYQVQYYLAVSQLNLDDYPNARTLFREIVLANPNSNLHDRAYLGMFNSYYLQGEYELALEITQRMLKASPHSEFLSLIHLKMARANLKLTRWAKARKHLRIIVHKFSDSFERFTAEKLLKEKRYFTIQVGAFMEQNKAEHLVRDLKLKNEYAYILETKDRANATFYRVRVGRIAKLDEAQTLRKKLKDQGYPALIYP